MLTKLDMDRASTFWSATMRVRYTSINRVDVQQAAKEVARSMAEPNVGAWSVLKRLVSYLVDHGRFVQVISEQRYVKAPLRWMRAYQEEHDVCSSIFSKASTYSKPEVGRKVRAA